MGLLKEPLSPEKRTAKRAVRIIYLGMTVFILLPFFLAWLTGSLYF